MPAYTVPAGELATLTQTQRAGGQYADDPTVYHVLHVNEADAGERKIPPGKYLVNDDGTMAYFVDPAINGKLKEWDNGQDVHLNKFSAPKTQLMQKIISGIFDQKLPWGLVLLGVLIAVTLELSGVPSLPFAVGVYLPLESSTPIFLGGAVRFVVDRVNTRRGRASATETEAEMSPGTLLSTGYIAGASIAGVICAFVAASPTVTNALGGLFKVPQDRFDCGHRRRGDGAVPAAGRPRLVAQVAAEHRRRADPRHREKGNAVA